MSRHTDRYLIEYNTDGEWFASGETMPDNMGDVQEQLVSGVFSVWSDATIRVLRLNIVEGTCRDWTEDTLEYMAENWDRDADLIPLAHPDCLAVHIADVTQSIRDAQRYDVAAQ